VEEESVENYIGIDLGTSTTCVAVVREEGPVVIPDAVDNPVMPSYVYIREDNRVLVGEPAKSEGVADPYNTIWGTKRLMGRKSNDPMIAECRERFPFTIKDGAGGAVMIESRGKLLPPEWVASVLLKAAAAQAARYLGAPVKKAVITVPGTFNAEQRDATSRAAARAGLEVLRLLNEPTAAALAWGFHKDCNQTIAVFDLGGGTLDVAVIRVGEGGDKVLGHGGEPWLGGEDFDQAVMDRVALEVSNKHRINVYRDKIAHLRLKYAAERAKIELSREESSRIFLPTICPDVSRAADADYTLSRVEFEKLVGPLVDRAVGVFAGALAQAGLTVADLDNVMLVGGMTRTPLVRSRLEEALGRPAEGSVNPDEAVALGAAIHAASYKGTRVSLAPPPSTKPAEDYLSSDADVQAMYTAAVAQGQDEAAAAPSEYPIETPSSAAAAVDAPPMAAPPRIMVAVASPLLPGPEVARIFEAARAAGGEWVAGGFHLLAGGGEEVRIRVFEPGPGGKPVGEFVIQTFPAGDQYPAGANIFFSVSSHAPFVMGTPK
jgi:molecular chaperone DnaK (HSP70)